MRTLGGRLFGLPGLLLSLGRRLLAPPILALMIVALGACGGGSSARTPDLAQFPLVPGAQIVTKLKQCDIGANAFCAWLLVVVDRRYPSGHSLSQAEHLLLQSHGWSSSDADTGEERAADSPGHKLRVSFSAAYGDLKGIDLGWISRPRPFALSLSRVLFDHLPAISVMLEEGNG